MENVLQSIHPQLLILIPTLWGVGMVLKASQLPNRCIPAGLCLLSVGLSCLYAAMEGAALWLTLWSGVTQGTVLWLTAWLTYEKGIKRLQEGGHADL